jgi:hypothetical protein
VSLTGKIGTIDDDPIRVAPYIRWKENRQHASKEVNECETR